MTSSPEDVSARETLEAKDATDARLDSGTGELTTPTDAKLAGQFISVFLGCLYAAKCCGVVWSMLVQALL